MNNDFQNVESASVAIFHHKRRAITCIQGPVSLWTVFPGYGIPILKIRRSRDRLIFNMGIPILIRRHLYIKSPILVRRPYTGKTTYLFWDPHSTRLGKTFVVDYIVFNPRHMTCCFYTYTRVCDTPTTHLRRCHASMGHCKIAGCVISKHRHCCLTFNMWEPSYLDLTRSISWLLMTWFLVSPGHQQAWYWLRKVGSSFQLSVPCQCAGMT